MRWWKIVVTRTVAPCREYRPTAGIRILIRKLDLLMIVRRSKVSEEDDVVQCLYHTHTHTHA